MRVIGLKQDCFPINVTVKAHAKAWAFLHIESEYHTREKGLLDWISRVLGCEHLRYQGKFCICFSH
jgi:hypothetical protein